MKNSNKGIKSLQEEMASTLSSEVYLLCIAASAAACNQQSIVAETLKTYVNRNCSLDAIYEALLQVYLFAGFPAALEGLTTFSVTLAECSVVYVPPVNYKYDVDEFKIRGEILCKQIYTTVYETMRDRLGKITPDLDEWMIIEGYGKTLSRTILDVKVRELINVAILAVNGWERQLYSHIRGALNVGATLGECSDALLPTMFLAGDEQYDIALRVLSKFSIGEEL